MSRPGRAWWTDSHANSTLRIIPPLQLTNPKRNTLFGLSGAIQCCSCLLGIHYEYRPSYKCESRTDHKLLVLSWDSEARSYVTEFQAAKSGFSGFSGFRCGHVLLPTFPHTLHKCVSCKCHGRVIKVVRAIGQFRVNCLLVATSTLHIRHPGVRTAFCRLSPDRPRP